MNNAPTREAEIAKQRVSNATRIVTKHDPAIAAIGTEGAIAYALLDVANAIRSQGPDSATKQMLAIADLLVDAIAERDVEKTERLAQDFQMLREGLDYDQHLGLGR